MLTLIKMVCLLDLPIEVFCSYIFPYLHKDELLWNVAFVCQTLQLYTLNFMTSVCIDVSCTTKEDYYKLLGSIRITDSISHIVNRNDIEYELVEELKITQLKTKIQDSQSHNPCKWSAV